MKVNDPTPRIGFLVDWLEYSYQSSVLKGAAQIARERGVELVALPGGVIDAIDINGRPRNRLYDLITSENFDALVVMTGTLGNARGMDVMEELCPTFAKSRICHVGIRVADSSCVLIDNEIGMRRMVEHLIQVHGHRRIAFVRGPEANAEAQARYRAYCHALDAAGIPFDERFVVKGEFQENTTRSAVASLFDERGLSKEDLDSVVCSSDTMALAALSELKFRGLVVPSDIALVGFDDVEEARQASPPISSVRQPLVEQGRAAMELALASLAASSVPRTTLLSTDCYFRRSCGCTAEDPGMITERPKAESRMSLDASLQKRRDNVLEEMRRSAVGAFDSICPNWELELFDALLEAFRGKLEAFRTSYDLLLERIVAGGGEVALGNQMITALRKQLSICAGDNPMQLRQLEGLLHDARILTADAIARAQGQKRLLAEKATRSWSELSCELSRSTTRPLGEILQARLPSVQIHRAYICGYTEEAGQAVLLCGFDEMGLVSREAIGVPFPAQLIFPPTLRMARTPSSWVVEPLFEGERQLGFAVLGLGEGAGYTFEILRKVLSVALYQALV